MQTGQESPPTGSLPAEQEVTGSCLRPPQGRGVQAWLARQGQQAVSGDTAGPRGAGLTEGVAAAPAGLRQADDDLLQVGSGGSGRRIGVFPAIAFTRFLCLKSE